ncbi:MAG: family 78 glycoside hydrolase catalytic domain [Hydrogeniiclostridium mannosilyticum]
MDPPAGRLKPQLLPAIQVVKTLAPVDVRRFDDNTRVFDFGQNFSGWVRIRVKGAAGETVCMKFAENAYEDGQIDSTTTRAAEALDTYTLKGDGEEVYEPHFTYHGFRYVRITITGGTEDNCVKAG